MYRLWTHRWRLIVRCLPMRWLVRRWYGKEHGRWFRLYCWLAAKAYFEAELEGYRKAGLL